MNHTLLKTLVAFSVLSVSAPVFAESADFYKEMDMYAQRTQASHLKVSASEYYSDVLAQDRAMWPSDVSQLPFTDFARASGGNPAKATQPAGESARQYYTQIIKEDRAMWPSDASQEPFIDSAIIALGGSWAVAAGE